MVHIQMMTLEYESEVSHCVFILCHNSSIGFFELLDIAPVNTVA